MDEARRFVDQLAAKRDAALRKAMTLPPAEYEAALRALDEPTKQQIAELLVADGLIKAVLLYRATSGCDLWTADRFLRSMLEDLRSWDRYREVFQAREDDMGLSAGVVAIGPYSPALLHFLDAPPERFEGTRAGTLIVQKYLLEADTRSSSELLAECFGVGVWEFNRHELDPARADLARLTEEFDEYEVERFVAFRDAGFKFFYVPSE